MEIWCDECGAQFRNDCTCSPVSFNEDETKKERWIGIDGHAYIGDPKRSSLAMHDPENCRCPSSFNFIPENWY